MGDISPSENENVSQAAGIVGFYTFLSRILGLVRDMVLASYKDQTELFQEMKIKKPLVQKQENRAICPHILYTSLSIQEIICNESYI